MNVRLPSQFNRDTMYKFLKDVRDSDGSPLSKKFVFDFASLEFIKPSGVAIFSNVIQYLFSKSVEVFFINYMPDRSRGQNDPKKFLDDCSFFEIYLGKKLSTGATPRSTTFPLVNLFSEQTYAWLDSTFFPWLERNLSVRNLNGAEEIKVCLQEMFNNIKDHSGQSIGCIFGQYFPAHNNPQYEEIVISISDFGVGIPTKVREREGTIGDSDAIELAISEGYTTKTNVRNRGAGLDVLVSNVVKNQRGSLYIHSNYGILSCTNSSTFCTDSSDSAIPYPGTFIEIVFHPKWVTQEPETEDFQW